MRDGSGIYTYPPGTPGVAGQTIFSARYNTFLDDLATTLNTVLPINMGGTGSNTGPAAADAIGAVKKSGDTMTGDLTISKTQPSLFLDKPSAGTPTAVEGKTAGKLRWRLALGNSAAESGSNAGSDFLLTRWDDAGTGNLGNAITISRSTGVMTLAGNLTINSTAIAGLNVNSNIDGWGASFINSNTGANSGAAYFRTSNDNSFASIGVLNAAGSSWPHRLLGNGNYYLTGSVNALSVQTTGQSTMVQAGCGGAVYSVGLHIGYPGGGTGYGISLRHTTDSTNAIIFMQTGGTAVGNIFCTGTTTAYNTTSDARLKEDLKTFDAGRIIDQTEVYDFAWKSTGERSYGVLAQQASEIYPGAFTYSNGQKEDWWGVDYGKYVPVLLQELKVLRARVAELEAKAAAIQPA